MKIKNFDSKILNMSLELTLEWGEYWLAPIQERIMLKLPSLSSSQADFLDSFSKEVQKDINLFIKKTLERKRIESEQLNEIVLSYINEKYSWINEDNIAKLFSQGCYYAWKDGLL
jgi:hypothetical protein